MKIKLNALFLSLVSNPVPTEFEINESCDCGKTGKKSLASSGEYYCTTNRLEGERLKMSHFTSFEHVHRSNAEVVDGGSPAE